jgi:hypothetical protein
MKLANLKNSLALVIVLGCSFLGGTANAIWYSENANPNSIGTINVSLNDSVDGACWTNLKEVREYAEEKLRQQGYEVVSKEGKYNFRISVHGGRSNVSVHLPLIVPRQQLINPVDLVVGNTGEDIG